MVTHQELVLKFEEKRKDLQTLYNELKEQKPELDERIDPRLTLLIKSIETLTNLE